MSTHADKTHKSKRQAAANSASQKQKSGESALLSIDKRPEALAQKTLQQMADNSPRVKQLQAMQEMANNSPAGIQSALFRAPAHTPEAVLPGAAGPEKHPGAPAPVSAEGRKELLHQQPVTGPGNAPAQRKIILRMGPIPEPGRISAQKLLNLLTKQGQGSPALQQVLAFLNSSSNCHLRITLASAEEGARLHGTTGIYVLGRDKRDNTLIQEQVMQDPWQFMLSPGFTIEVTVYLAPDQDPLQAAVTLLHELELHAVHAGHLLMQLNRQLESGGTDINAMIAEVMQFMQKADEHLDFARMTSLLQSAAGIRGLVAGSPWREWGQGVLDFVGRDVMEQFSSAVLSRGVTSGQALEQMNYLDNLSASLLNRQAPPHNPGFVAAAGAGAAAPRRPAAAPAVWADIPHQVARWIQHLVLQRMPWPEIVPHMELAFGVRPELTIDLYRNTVLPWLVAQISPEASLDQQRRFLADHGVPDLLALDGLTGATEKPSVAVPGLEYGIHAAPREIRTVAFARRSFRIEPDEVASDGDCFFNALIRLGVHQGLSVLDLRQLALRHGARPAITTAGEWAGEADMAALARALGLRIVLVRFDLHYQAAEHRDFPGGNNTVFIAHIFGGHFTPMRRPEK